MCKIRGARPPVAITDRIQVLNQDLGTEDEEENFKKVASKLAQIGDQITEKYAASRVADEEVQSLASKIPAQLSEKIMSKDALLGVVNIFIQTALRVTALHMDVSE